MSTKIEPYQALSRIRHYLNVSWKIRLAPFPTYSPRTLATAHLHPKIDKWCLTPYSLISSKDFPMVSFPIAATTMATTAKTAVSITKTLV